MTEEDMCLLKKAILTLKNNTGFDEIKLTIAVADIRVYWTEDLTVNSQPIIRIDLIPKF